MATDEKVPFSEHAFRYLGLFFICMMTFGSYYIYDIPSALTQDVVDNWYGVHEFQYSLLYAVYNFPNMVIVFFGGFFIDTIFGLRLGSLIFCVLVMTGQILFSISASSHTFWLALLGRVIFGLGGESLSVAQSTFCAAWFNGRSDLNLAFAITLGFSRIGSAVNFQVTPALREKYNLPTSVWFGAICCGVSFVACIVLCFLEIARKRKDKAEVAKNDAVSIKDITKFPKMVWIIFALVIFFYVPLFVFVSIGTQFFVTKFGASNSFAGVLTSIPYYTAAPSPVIGFIIDRVGHNLSWMAASMVLLVTSHGILGFTHVNPYVGMIMMGFSYAIMAASIWPTIPALIPSSRLGTAYGLAFAFQNAAIALMGLLINAILEKTNNDYYYTEGIFVGFAAFGLLLVVLLILIDLKEKKINIPSAQMKANIKLLNSQSEPLLSGQSQSINYDESIANVDD